MIFDDVRRYVSGKKNIRNGKGEKRQTKTSFHLTGLVLAMNLGQKSGALHACILLVILKHLLSGNYH